MKLNIKRTLFVGFAFFLICAFWQAYDTIIPKILTDKFGLAQSLSGVVMALDNILALFLLPIFGALSDRTRTRLGKRTPYILIGTIIAAVALIGLSFADNMQLSRIDAIRGMDGAALEELYEEDPSITLPDSSDPVILSEAVSKDEFISLTPDDAGYADYAIPARQAYAWKTTVNDTTPIIVFMAILFVILLAMSIFRSPAVALMPDVTVKTQRSGANAIINLMGALGGISILVLGTLFGTGKTENALMSYSGFFTVVSGLMIAALVVFLATVRENKWAAEMIADSEKYHIDTREDDGSGDRKLSHDEKISLLLILASVVCWYMGYNAVTSKYSVYAGKVLGLDYNLTLTIANAAAIVSYLPIGVISSKVGRKKCILAGIVMLTSSFFAASFLRSGTSVIVADVLFVLAGIGWATINVNSYPMVVELSHGSDVGRYTGFYYTASMAAQIATPILSGVAMDVKFTYLFPYAAVFAGLAFFTMLFVRHGDNKPAKKGVLESFESMDD